MTYVVEKIEAGQVLLVAIDAHDDKSQRLSKDQLPSGLAEGDIVHQRAGQYIIDPVATKARMNQLQTRLDQLFKKKRRE